MRNDKVRGFTMIEVMISLAVFAIISLAIFALIEAGSTSYNQTTRLNQLQENGRKALEEMAAELRIANPAGAAFTVTKESDGSYSVEFQRVTELLRDGQDGYDPAAAGGEGAINYTAYYIKYMLVPSMADANNNGISDDWRLVRIEDPSGTKKTAGICEYVEPGGFIVTRDPPKTAVTNPAVSTVTLTLNLWVADSKQTMIRKSVSTKVMLRNKIVG